MPTLPWMKLYVGQIAVKTMGMSLEAKGALLTLITLTWESGSIHKEDAEAVLGKPIEAFGRRFSELIQDANGVLSIDFVTHERGLNEGKKKQAASAAIARWERERMRPHKSSHSERNTEHDANAMRIEEEDKEEETIPDGIGSPSGIQGENISMENKPTKKAYGRADINECIAYFERALGHPLQGTVKQERIDCKRLLDKFAKGWPKRTPVENVKLLIDLGKKTIYGPHMAGFEYLYRKHGQIIGAINGAEQPQEA